MENMESRVYDSGVQDKIFDLKPEIGIQASRVDYLIHAGQGIHFTITIKSN